MLRRKWAYHKGIADGLGMKIIMYEGGTHVVPHPTVDSDPDILAAYLEFNYSTRMADLYQAAFDAYYEVTGDGYNVFVETSGPSKHGYWGGKRFTGDVNPRWSKYVEWNNAHTGTWEVRDKDTFVGQL